MAVTASAAVALALAGCSGGGSSSSQGGSSNYPTKPITFTVQAAAGGGSDTTSRAIASVMEDKLGGNIVVQNKPGASGSIAVASVSKMEPDGYNIGFCPIECSFFDLAGYDVKPSSVEYLGQIMNDVGTIAVSSDSPYKSLQDLVAAAKTKKITVGNSGAGSSWELASKILAKKAGVTFSPVPFDGAAPAVTAAMGGKIDAVVAGEAETRSGAQNGKLRVLAIFSGTKSQFFPQIPTAKSQGYDVEFGSWGGIYAPKGLPSDVKKTLESAIAKSVKDPAFADPMKKAGITVTYKNANDFTKFVMSEHQMFAKIMQ
jgi:tripartite-type tricarboxylate transporter receptor subunit TctC